VSKKNSVNHEITNYCKTNNIQIPDTIRRIDLNDNDNEIFEIDGYSRWDMPSNDYYDIESFPEGYTGYDGSEVWKLIHKKLCFSQTEKSSGWEKNFNKVISGLHSIVSAQIIRGIRDRVNTNEKFGVDEIWNDPALEFSRRFYANKIYVENLFFTHMLLLVALSKVKERYLEDCVKGFIDMDDLNNVFQEVPLLGQSQLDTMSRILSTRLNTVESGDVWQIRMRCRSILRIMNCVQCNKCRFHGKIVTMGVITALKIVLDDSSDTKSMSNRLTRTELATLLTTLAKCSSAIQLCQEMTNEIHQK
jgi:Endoplasmic Reticulum Oxidoreductin 1 (ERO1)